MLLKEDYKETGSRIRFKKVLAASFTSPTFTLANRYEGKLVLNHLDVYRLDRFQEVEELGLSELIDSNSLTVIEWGDVISSVLSEGFLEIRFGNRETFLHFQDSFS